MKQLHCFLITYLCFFYVQSFAQTKAQKCRISRIEFSDSSFYHFKYDEQGRLKQYNYDSDAEKEHRTFQYFYTENNRISHISLVRNETLMYVCNYVYAHDTFIKRRVAFFERKIVRDEVFHYNEKRQIDRIDYQQSDGDSIIMRFEYNDAGYPIHKVRLSNDFQKNAFTTVTWDTTQIAMNPFETLFEGYPISNFFDREIGNFISYPIKHPITHYISRMRDELGKQIHSDEWFFSDFKTNEFGFITDMKMVNIWDGKERSFLQRCFYENCPTGQDETKPTTTTVKD
jgi:hypothetical protein